MSYVDRALENEAAPGLTNRLVPLFILRLDVRGADGEISCGRVWFSPSRVPLTALILER